MFTEPQQGASYDDLLSVARAAEDCGHDAFFRSDHHLASASLQDRRTHCGSVREACALTGRDLRNSGVQVLCCGRDGRGARESAAPHPS